MRNRAVFLDRDGTLVHTRHYPAQPEELVLYDEIGAGLRRLQAADWQLIVITNQAGLAHGYFNTTALMAMHAYLQAQLLAQGVQLNAIYYCPHQPHGSVPMFTGRCMCRKPQPGMLLRAAAEHRIDLRASWFIGDILDDVEAGNRAGCRTVLVDLGTETTPTTPLRRPNAVVKTTRQALDLIADLDDADQAPSAGVAARALGSHGTEEW